MSSILPADRSVRGRPADVLIGEVLHTHNSLWGLAEPIVRELVTRFDETCYFIVREGNQARFQERIDCHQAIRYVIEPGVVSPLYAGAAGRAILAGMPPTTPPSTSTASR